MNSQDPIGKLQNSHLDDQGETKGASDLQGTIPLEVEDLEIVILHPILEIETRGDSPSTIKEIVVKKGNDSVLQTEIGRLHLVIGKRKVDVLHLLKAIESKGRNLVRRRDGRNQRNDSRNEKTNFILETDLTSEKGNERENEIDNDHHRRHQETGTENVNRRKNEHRPHSLKPRTDLTQERRRDGEFPAVEAEDREEIGKLRHCGALFIYWLFII